MTRAIHSVLVGLVIGMVVQSPAFSEEKEGKPLRISVSTHADFTDNRDSVDVNKTDNTDIFLSPRIDFLYNGNASHIDLFYVPSIRYRSDAGDNGDDTTWQHDFGLEASRAVTERTRLRLYEKYDYNDDSAIETGGAIVRGNHTYSENTIKGGLNTDIYRYSNLDFLLRNNLKRFDDNAIAKTSDENISSFDASYRHQINETLRYVLGAKYSMFIYDNSLSRDFNSILGKVGLENSFTPNTFGVLVAGWQTSDFDDNSIDAEDEPYFLASIESRTGADLNIGATVSHGIRDTDAYPFSVQTYSEFRGFADFNITPKLVLRGSGTYRLSEYDKDRLTDGVTGADFKGADGGDVVTIVGDIMLDWGIMDNVSVYAGYRYEDVDSDVGQTFSKNTAHVGASLSF
jgi:hypothetical protein